MGYKEETSKVTKISDSTRVLEFKYQGDELPLISNDEKNNIAIKVQSGYEKSKTSLRIKDISLWKLELISRYSKKLGLNKYKNIGNIIETLVNTLISDSFEHENILELGNEPYSDKIKRKKDRAFIDSLEKLNKTEIDGEIKFSKDDLDFFKNKIDFGHFEDDVDSETRTLRRYRNNLYRAFKTKHGYEKISLADLTYNKNIILRTISLNIFAPNLLTKFEQELLGYISLTYVGHFLKMDMENIPDGASYFFDLMSPKTEIYHERLFDHFGREPRLNDLQKIVNMTKGIGGLALKDNPEDNISESLDDARKRFYSLDFEELEVYENLLKKKDITEAEKYLNKSIEIQRNKDKAVFIEESEKFIETTKSLFSKSGNIYIKDLREEEL